MGNIKIPKHSFLYIASGPFKGYQAEYRNKYHGGKTITVLLLTGIEIYQNIDNVVFINNIGEEFQYFKTSDDDYTLKNLKTDIEQEQDDSTFFQEVEKKSSKRISIELVPGTFEQEYIEKDWVSLKSDNLTTYLSDFLNILDFSFNNSFINTHSSNLDILLTTNNIVLDEISKKKYCVAYVFIFINNLNIGYNNEIRWINNKGEECKITSNDDPSYVYCVSISSKFITEPEYDLKVYIENLLLLMKTNIYPSIKINEKLNKKSIILNSKSKSEVKIKFMRFPILNEKNKNDIFKNIKIYIKNTLINKIKNDILDSSNESENIIRQKFIKNFNYYIDNNKNKVNLDNYGYINIYNSFLEIEKDKFYKLFPSIERTQLNIIILESKKKIFDTINKDSSISDVFKEDLIHNFEHYLENTKISTLILKYINMYKNIILSENKKFYNNPFKYASNTEVSKSNSNNKNRDNSDLLKKSILLKMKNILINKINTGDLNPSDKKILEYIYNNALEIIQLSIYKLLRYSEILKHDVDIYQKNKISNILLFYDRFYILLNNEIKNNEKNNVVFNQKNYRDNINISKITKKLKVSKIK